MRGVIPNYVDNCQWDSDLKVNSRIISIISMYRQFFNERLPPGKQYWSMCGAHFTKSGKKITKLKGELGHITKEGLIEQDQFYGVDEVKSIIDHNREIHPDVKWYHGDFLETMEEISSIDGEFNPHIINYDGVMLPKFGTQYLSSILNFIDYNVKGELLLISNFVLKSPYRSNPKYKFTIQETIEELSKAYWLPDHWDIYPQSYVYKGASIFAKTEMGMLIFVKQKHDITNITYTRDRRIVNDASII